MIPSPPGMTYLASYQQPSIVREGETVEFQLPVVAWSDDGEALVAQAGKLVPAADVDGCVGFHDSDPAPDLGVVPGGGWRAEVTEENGSVWSAPVVAWVIKSAGYAVPLVADINGHAKYPKDLDRPYRVYHPDTHGALNV